MFYIIPQPTHYRPTYCYASRPRPAGFFSRPSPYHYPFELSEEPSITWVIQRPIRNKDSKDQAEITKAQTPACKLEMNDDGQATVVHRNTAAKETPTQLNKPFSVRIKLPVGGMTAEDLQVRVRDKTLFITGEKRVTANNFVRTTSFARQFPVEDTVDVDKMTAVINGDGVLVVTAPLKARALPNARADGPSNVATASVEATRTDNEATVTDAATRLATTPDSENTPTGVAVEGTKPQSNNAKDEPKQVVTTDDAHEQPILVPFKLRVSQNDDKAFAVTVQLPPGVTAKDIDLQVNSKGVLSISGEQRKEHNGSTLTSKFVRHFPLDKTIEVDKITATLDDKTRSLTVTVPKKPAVEPTVQKITIHVGGEVATGTNAETEDKDKKQHEVVPSLESGAKSTTGNEQESHAQAESAAADENPHSIDESSSTGSKDESWTDVEKTTEEVHVEKD